MTNIQPKYAVRAAELKDVMFFFEAMCAISDATLDIVDFNAQYKIKLKDPSSIQLVLEVDGKLVVGCILAQIRQSLSDPFPYVEILDLYIAHKYRKLKAADFLYTGLEELVMKKKIYQVRVNCNINSTLNQNFYVKKGYKIFKKHYKKVIY